MVLHRIFRALWFTTTGFFRQSCHEPSRPRFVLASKLTTFLDLINDPMNLTTHPLFGELADCDNILLAGAGGGFDIYSGIPLYFALRSQNKNVHLAKSVVCLAQRPRSQSEWITVLKSPRKPKAPALISPKRLCVNGLMNETSISAVVYSFPQTGVVPLKKSYDYLVSELDLDAIVLLDGGTDSLMRGDETGLGTPSEDAASLVAVSQTNVRKKALNLPWVWGRSFSWSLSRAVSGSRGGPNEGWCISWCIFCFCLKQKRQKKYADLVAYSTDKTSRPSIVNTSIASAVAGEFGNHHVNKPHRGQ